MAKRWVHPMQFTGTYPTNWAGYTFLQWSSLGYWHEGVDYNYGAGDDDFGMPVFAASEGTIEWIGDSVPGYGHHLFIRHDDETYGTIYSHYAHLKQNSEKVKIGDSVTTGQQIAECGNTGWNNMYAHLHFEVRRPLGGGYNFWPDPNQGWNQDKIKQYYFDSYLFIEEKKKQYIENPCKDLETQVTALKAENKSLKEQATKAANDLSDAKKKITELTNNINLLNTQILTLRQDLAAEKAKNITNLSAFSARELFAAAWAKLLKG